jgi:hypothetical protein
MPSDEEHTISTPVRLAEGSERGSACIHGRVKALQRSVGEAKPAQKQDARYHDRRDDSTVCIDRDVLRPYDGFIPSPCILSHCV